MSISQLSLTDFRNLKSTTLDFDPSFNLICGDNGSGKTSLLEAIFVLCQGHSFRTHLLKQCIQHEKSGLLLFGRFDGFKAGLSKTGKKLEIKIDGDSIKRRSELVRRAPINIVNSASFDLIEGAPAVRRKFLDWCLFHVKHEYADIWVQFQHALRQRNRLLKSGRDISQLDYWDQALIEPALKLSLMRKECVDELKRIVEENLESIVSGINPGFEYWQGWAQNQELGEAMRQTRSKDLKSGFTGSGVHRDNLKLTSSGRPVTEILSRGQSKRLCLALLLAVLKLVSRNSENRIVLLIDDLHSELDRKSQNLIYQQLLKMDLQLFISNVETSVPAGLGTKEVKMFHVEHGTIKPRIFS
jgi:DNA replication and repair protein RecF